MTAVVRPGQTLGILGGGQLARMMALEARRMGYGVRVLDPAADCPAAPVADAVVVGAFDEVDAALALARAADVVTLDTEHVSAQVLSRVASVTPVRPGPAVLEVIQDRLRQRRFLESQGAPQPRFADASSASDLGPAARAVGLPCIMKARRSGYDGKGQARVDDAAGLEDAWGRIGRVPAVLEELVAFDKEVSVVLARSGRGEVRFFPIVENVHRRHVLYTSRAPADVPPALAARAREVAAGIAAGLDGIGVMAVELFVVGDALLVNEVAPRPHNSGHFTFGGCATSQFEQHVRAVCGLPLGDPSLLRGAATVNLLGDLWAHGEPDLAGVLAHPHARLHLYGKRRAAPGRKMGHVLVLDDDAERALRTVEAMADRLAERAGSGRELLAPAAREPASDGASAPRLSEARAWS